MSLLHILFLGWLKWSFMQDARRRRNVSVFKTGEGRILWETWRYIWSYLSVGRQTADLMRCFTVLITMILCSQMKLKSMKADKSKHINNMLTWIPVCIDGYLPCCLANNFIQKVIWKSSENYILYSVLSSPSSRTFQDNLDSFKVLQAICNFL